MNNLKGNIFGGITAGIVALPLALAFGVQSGLGANAGIYGAIFLGIIASLLGGTPTQISGPTGPMTIISASVVTLAIYKYGNVDSGLGMILITFILSGIFQVLFGIIKIGKYIKYIPYPVLSGFMSGIGIIIILLQVYPVLGYGSPKKIIDVFLHLGEPLQHINWSSITVAAVTIVLVYILPFVIKIIPSPLFALLFVSIGVHYLQIDVAKIGKIPEGMPALKVDALLSIDLSVVLMVIFPALTLAGLGAIDTLLTSVVADNITKTRHNSNRELIGQGIGNVVVALFGGIPGAGATMRTVVNVKSGGTTRLSGLIHGVFLFVILLGAGKWVAHIPLAVLAGILITVGIGIIDRKGLTDVAKIPRPDATVMVIVLVLTVFVDLLQAVGIGMIISAILFMKRISDLVESGTEVTPVQHLDKEVPWSDEQGLPNAMLKDVYIQRLDGPVFFGAVTRFQQQMSTIPDNVKIVIIRMKRVPFMDQSGLYAFESAIQDLQARGIIVLMTIIQPQPFYMMKRINLIPGLVPEENTFKSFEECSEWLRNYQSQKKAHNVFQGLSL